MTQWLTRGALTVVIGTAIAVSPQLTKPIAAADATGRPAPAAARLRLDLTNAIKLTSTVPLALITPAMAANIGPGSHLLIEIPNEGTFGCTANFIWANGGTRYLGAAGHCFIPEGTTATHGVGADYSAAGVEVSVCVSNCSFGGQTGFIVTGTMVRLGAVAYARQTAADGDVGNDFGVVTIPAALASRIRASLPVFGGPDSVEDVTLGQPLCHYGNGVGVGETFLTMARVGVGGGSTATYWMADMLSAPGDSGAAVVTCGLSGTELQGQGAAGILTHLGIEIGVEHGFVLGTTVGRAIAMAQEAGLALSIVLP
jgi:hypothetical protein